MAENKTPKIKQLTILLEYKETNVTAFDQSSDIAYAVIEAIRDYNMNRSSNYSMVRIGGLWVEPDEEEGEIYSEKELKNTHMSNKN